MFPVALDFTVLRAAVAGAGAAAQRRVRLLDEAGAKHVRVFAPDAPPPLSEVAGSRLTARLPEDADLAAIDVLFIADLAPAQAERLAQRARRLRVLVNTEDVRPLCDFHVPAMVRRGDLVLAVSTGGASPGLARRLKRHLADQFGEEWAQYLTEIADARAGWRAEGVALGELAQRTDDLIEQKGWLS